MDRNGSMVLRLCYDLVDIDRKAQIANDIIAHARELAVDPVGITWYNMSSVSLIHMR